MGKYSLHLLDCTLRDGGYVNEWNWGFYTAKDIVNALVKARVDVIEVGFLRNVENYNKDITMCERIEELNALLPFDGKKSMFSAMAIASNYNIQKLSPYSGVGIEMIRITFHDYDIEEGLSFAREVIKKGYKLSINPINIMGYSDEQIIRIVKRVNEIQPYQFSIVDTFGSMKRRDLDRIVGIVDNNLARDIRLALHLHENMSLSCLLAQNFIDMHLGRPISIDASLMGIGRTPGNLPLELISDYINEYTDNSYDIDFMMDAIQDYISPIKGKSAWGYTPVYFLSAKFNLHRNYAEYYLEKGDLTNRDIKHILSKFDRNKANVFDAEYADEIYKDYMGNKIDDSTTRNKLEQLFKNKEILVLAPGMTMNTHEKSISQYIFRNQPLIISVNFIPDGFKSDYVFYSNNKRFSKLESTSCKVIVTSNLLDKKADYYVDYESLVSTFDRGGNSLLMLLKLFDELGVEEVAIAGADGYEQNRQNYYHSNIRNSMEHDKRYNEAVAQAIYDLRIKTDFITPSAYQNDIYRWK